MNVRSRLRYGDCGSVYRVQLACSALRLLLAWAMTMRCQRVKWQGVAYTDMSAMLQVMVPLLVPEPAATSAASHVDAFY